MFPVVTDIWFQWEMQIIERVSLNPHSHTALLCTSRSNATWWLLNFKMQTISLLRSAKLAFSAIWYTIRVPVCNVLGDVYINVLVDVLCVVRVQCASRCASCLPVFSTRQCKHFSREWIVFFQFQSTADSRTSWLEKYRKSFRTSTWKSSGSRPRITPWSIESFSVDHDKVLFNCWKLLSN